MESRFTISLLLLLAADLPAATYYIDYVGGSDAAAGTSSGAAWKRCPGMTGFTGSYSHAAGDRFIFKGGVVWPASVQPLIAANDGTSNSWDYYGVDKTWFAGNSWNRPIFDGGGLYRISLEIYERSYQIVDNLEFTNNGIVEGILSVGLANHYTIQNCYFHGWNTNGFTNDVLICINGDFSNVYSDDNIITNCLFDGSPNGTNAGKATYNIYGKVLNCTVRNMPNGIVIGYGTVSGCQVGPTLASFSGAHENGIETLAKGPVTISGNTVHDSPGNQVIIGEGDISYVYNNLLYNPIACPAISVFNHFAGTNYLYNNTIVCADGQGALYLSEQAENQTITVVARNNHFINGTPGSDPYLAITADHNYTNATIADAATLGYTSSTSWQPVSPGSPTAGAGTNLSGIFMTDILGRQRSRWDIGAYEYPSPILSAQTLIIKSP